MIHMHALQRQDFVIATAGQHQQLDGRERKSAFHAKRDHAGDHLTEQRQFQRREKALDFLDWELVMPVAGLSARKPRATVKPGAALSVVSKLLPRPDRR